METFLGAMSGVGIIFIIGYLVLTIFIIVYFFRMANDVRNLNDSLDVIKKLMIKQNWKNEEETSEKNYKTIDKEESAIKPEFTEDYTTNKFGVVGEVEMKKNKEAIGRLIEKMKQNECIVRVLASSKMEIWSENNWNNIIESKKQNEFQILYNNFDK
jgi:uncharacterized membrane protein YhiD involved in acid resistance